MIIYLMDLVKATQPGVINGQRHRPLAYKAYMLHKLGNAGTRDDGGPRSSLSLSWSVFRCSNASFVDIFIRLSVSVQRFSIHFDTTTRTLGSA